MKKNLFASSLIIASLMLSVASCKKDTKDDKGNDTEISTHSDDQSEFAADVDATITEANATLESTTSFAGKGEDIQGADLSNADVAVNVTANPMTITITYHGANLVGDRDRTGKVVLSMAQGAKWKTAGTAVTISYQDLKITRKRDNKSITLNGTQTYTNVSGGLLIGLFMQPGGSVTHTLTSDGINVSFDNNTQRSWKVAKQYVATFTNGNYVITATGTHTEGNITGVAEWGTNRFGRAFSTSTVEPLVIKGDCAFRITSGKVKHTTPATTATATFGLNADGNATSCPGTNAYYCKIIWTGPNGNSLTAIFPY